MRNRPRVLALIEASKNRYSRYVEKARTHHYDIEPGQNVSSEWIELLRIKPESWTDKESA